MTMQTRPLGKTGTDVTILGYGAMELRSSPRARAITDEEAGQVLGAVLDGGINLIDTSIDYGRSEELIGKFLSHRRDEYFLASKCGCPLEPPPGTPPPFPHDYSAANVRAGIEQSLRRLRTDRLDLVQVHMSPSPAQLEAGHTVQTLQELRDEGKIRFIGMSGTLPALPDQIAMGVFEVFQIPYSAVQREHEDLITAAAQAGAGTLIRGGVARGAPAGDKGWQFGPFGIPQGEAQRRWQSAGLDDLRGGMPAMEFMLRSRSATRPCPPQSSGRPAPSTSRRTWQSPRKARCPLTSTRKQNAAWSPSRSSLRLAAHRECGPAAHLSAPGGPGESH